MRIGNQMSMVQYRILSNRNSTNTDAELTRKISTAKQDSGVTLSDNLQKLRNEIKTEQANSAGNVSEGSTDVSAAGSNRWETARIRDVDMAKEMLEYTKENILLQAHTSMMALAPKQFEGVLQLLR